MPGMMEIPRIDTDGIVWDLWVRNAEQSPEREAILHWSAGQPPYRWLRGDLLRAAGKYAEHLGGLGVGKGDVCALIIRHRKEFYPIYMAVSAMGALPSVLAYPNQRLHPDKFRQGLEGMAKKSGLHWVLTERDLESITSPLLLREGSTVRGIFFPLEWTKGPGKARGGSSIRESGPATPVSCSIPPVRRACRRPSSFLTARSLSTSTSTASPSGFIQATRS